MNASEQVAYEHRVRSRFVVLAALAGVLILVQAVIQAVGPKTSVNELTLDLIVAHRRFPLDVIGAVIDALGLFALTACLVWLHRISSARTTQIRDWVRWLVVAGGVLSGVMAVVYAVVVAVKADEFVTTGLQTYQQANALTDGTLFEVIPLVAQLASLLLTIGFIWVSLNALRVGLLTRPLGYVGVLAGALVLFPLGLFVYVIQALWLAALALMFSGRWPNGQPPAWEAGEAVPWPSAGPPRGGSAPAPAPRARGRRASLRQLQAQAEAAPSGVAVADPEAPASGGEAAGARSRSATSKRKRKRRR
jgi:hypothetical protein